MSKIFGEYEISVWEDISIDFGFEERKLGVIGSGEMRDMGVQCRVFNPQLTQNTNGEKKLQFSLYKIYTDNITGIKTINPYYDWLVNERKVKLYYKNQWFDFVIKNISENSSNYLYTYQLEEVYVQELSKNGFGLTLDAELNNNLGTAKQLAEYCLSGTDWSVESEALVEKVEDNLVYVRIPQNAKVIRLIDQKEDLYQGVQFDKNSNYGNIINGITQTTIEVLGFYSSCKNTPHLFQFIYLPEGYDKSNVLIDENHFIMNPDCQFYLEVNKPAADYHKIDEYNFLLPYDCQIILKGDSGITDDFDTTISNWYRGKRYGLSHQTSYIPELKKYCNHYLIDGKEHYGFTESEYISPTYVTNMITNSEFTSNSGWTGGYYGITKNAKSKYAITPEAVLGKFDKGKQQFSTVTELLRAGTYNEQERYLSYLKIQVPAFGTSNTPVLLNSGMYDLRGKIKPLTLGEEWIFNAVILDDKGEEQNIEEYFEIKIGQVYYNTSQSTHNIDYIIGEVKENSIFFFEPNSPYKFPSSEELIKNSNLRLIFIPKNKSSLKTFFLQKIELYKKYLNTEEKIIPPLTSNDLSTESQEGEIINHISFVSKEEIDNAETLEKFSFTRINVKEIDYSVQVPIYNEGSERVRAISETESNYFNILQSIAETFETWMEIVITHDQDGQTLEKKIIFKNYSGKNNYAAIRYGVNLKDIQRNFESKKIVSKLIVKQNANELATNGFCTIARANSNPTGENYIYDFRYYFDQGLMNEKNYLTQNYYEVNPVTGIEQKGQDLNTEHFDKLDKNSDWNIQNYYNRIKRLNDMYYDISNQISNQELEKIELEGEIAVEEGIISAGRDQIEEITNEFISISGGFEPQSYGDEIIQEGRLIDYELSEKNTILLNKDNVEFVSKNGVDYQARVQLFSPYNPTCGQAMELSFSGIGRDDDIEDCEEQNNSYNVRFIQSTEGLSITAKGMNTKAWYYVSFDFISSNVDGIEFIETTPSIRNFYIDGEHYDEFPGEYRFHQPPAESEARIRFLMRGNGELRLKFVAPHNERGYCELNNFSIKPIATYLVNQKILIDVGFEYSTKNRETNLLSTHTRDIEMACVIPAYEFEVLTNYSLTSIPPNGNELDNLLKEYSSSQQTIKNAQTSLERLKLQLNTIDNEEDGIKAKKEQANIILSYKQYLNELFYTQYCRFIQEGTWIDEKYVDDEKYYTDSLSVIYNSCYPQVAYTINTLALEKIPGYENFNFNLGEKTFVEDQQFFGTTKQIEVIITEAREDLDDPTKNTLKVQNFKNAFQDLFQKITATVQQTQYNAGSYQKAATLAEGEKEVTQKFLTDALSTLSDFAIPGQTTVDYTDGILLTNTNTQDQLKLVGGAILLGTLDKSGQRKWRSGLTPDGLSASLITAGTLDVNNITIKSGNEETFKWNAFGLSAFDVDWSDGLVSGAANPYKFVRFDKYGLYGITDKNNQAIDGRTWKPDSFEQVKEKASFAITWDGLKIENDKVKIHLGDSGNDVFSIKDNANKPLVTVTKDGTLSISGKIYAQAGGTIGGWTIGDNCLITSKQSLGTSDSFHLYSSGDTDFAKIASSDSKNDWRLAIGTNFGVDKQGNLYAKGVDISGTINATNGTLNNLTLTGNIYIDDVQGKIIHKNSKCQWDHGGISLTQGKVGPCYIVNEYSGYMEKMPYTVKIGTNAPKLINFQIDFNRKDFTYTNLADNTTKTCNYVELITAVRYVMETFLTHLSYS